MRRGRMVQFWLCFFTTGSKAEAGVVKIVVSATGSPGLIHHIHQETCAVLDHWSVHHGTSESGTLQITRSVTRISHVLSVRISL